ncbi:hypothetical protein BD410DRAFT_719125 [Rickenella mellea]|uniref:Restriction endonuclease type IV Mrr domain-containing protein n=1 Tax=Rickenella mellea TaxID=50990 RepID=A0A4Y7QBF8_9AGAM|nr:hypothetical protein BD410DRAFT_719125 [Rickenella mellea]
MHSPTIPSKSTVEKGLQFEKRSLALLQAQMSMSLHHVGGKDDGGIDLQGWWWLPPLSLHNIPFRRRLRILAQCKAEKKRMGPNYVREIEGVLHRYAHTSKPESPSEYPSHPTVGLLISESEFTKSTIVQALSSPIPLLIIHLPPLNEDSSDDVENASIGYALWNPALGGKNGLLGGEMELRWERTASGAGGRPGLWWRGAKLKSWVPPDGSLIADSHPG